MLLTGTVVALGEPNTADPPFSGMMRMPTVSRARVHQRRPASLLASDVEPINRQLADLQAADPCSPDRKPSDREGSNGQRTEGDRSNRESPDCAAPYTCLSYRDVSP